MREHPRTEYAAWADAMDREDERQAIEDALASRIPSDWGLRDGPPEGRPLGELEAHAPLIVLFLGLLALSVIWCVVSRLERADGTEAARAASAASSPAVHRLRVDCQRDRRGHCIEVRT